MNAVQVAQAASLLWRSWRDARRIAALPEACRPASREEGYAVQAELARVSGERVIGWKIAATSAAGQRHIHVDGPIAGRLLERFTVRSGASVPLAGNAMRVAEAEFAFRMRKPLPPRATPYSVDEILEAVASLHPAIELPDTRFVDCTTAGAAQLIAEEACAGWFVLGAATRDAWQTRDLAAHTVSVSKNSAFACEGLGSAVLGGPRVALAWLANELRALGEGLEADDIVTTGTCNVPLAIAPGDRIRADFGALGSVEVSLTG